MVMMEMLSCTCLFMRILRYNCFVTHVCMSIRFGLSYKILDHQIRLAVSCLACESISSIITIFFRKLVSHFLTVIQAIATARMKGEYPERIGQLECQVCTHSQVHSNLLFCGTVESIRMHNIV